MPAEAAISAEEAASIAEDAAAIAPEAAASTAGAAIVVAGAGGGVLASSFLLQAANETAAARVTISNAVFIFLLD
jgi:hypothetical protein